MSAKVLVNKDISSDEEMDSELDSEGFDEDLDDINTRDDSDCDASDGQSGTKGAIAGNPTNTSWADAINKVLSVKSKQKSIILSKAKKDSDLKEKIDDRNDGLEFVNSDGTVVKSNDNKSNKKRKTNEKSGQKLSKNQWEVMHKLKPNPEDKERERMLCSVATKGVVQLFNAVKEQQKTIDKTLKQTGSSETKRDKALTQFNKKQFLDKLKQNDISSKDNKTNDSDNKKQSEEQKWKVLRDDFMIGAKMKDWDKQSDSDEDFDH